MPRGRPKGSGKIGTSVKPQLKCIDRKPIRPLERQRMRPWLMNLLDKGSCSQLAWYDKRQKTFRVSWKHAAGQTFNAEADATLFELWAHHTGKYYPGDIPDPKKWKANFRCALHSLQDIHEDKGLGVKKGDNAYRVYRFLDEKMAKKPVLKKANKVNDVGDDDSDDDYSRFRNAGTKSRPRKMDDLDSEGSERGYSPEHEGSHSDWEMMETRGQEETEAEKSPLPHFDQLCESAFHLSSSEAEPEVVEVVEEPTTPDMTSESMSMEADSRLLYFGDGEEMVSFMGDGQIVDITSESFFGIQEEVTTVDHVTSGPSVIVIEEQGAYSDYMNYTSLENVSY